MVALILVALLNMGTLDNDGVLEFIWDAAAGNVDHYDVYVSVDDGEFILAGSAAVVPTADNPYVLPITIAIGSKVVIRVQAVDARGNTGPMSAGSKPVWNASSTVIRQPRSE